MKISIGETTKGRIEYSLVGQGKAILFVHGGHVNCRETIFQKGLDADKFCFITPSRPGYGSTPLTDSTRTPKGTANLFVALLDQLKLSKVVIVGISAGGLTALEIAANYPDRVESLVLMSALTKKWFAKSDKVYIGGKRIFSPGVERFTWFLYRSFFRIFPRLMTAMMFRQLSKYRPVEFTKEESEELKRMTWPMRSGYGFSNDLDQAIDEDVLPRIKCPTLILHSESDNAVDSSHSREAKAKIENSKLVTFKNRWGHLLWLGAEYEPALKEFRQQIE